MPKWADYAITKVQYSASGTHITRVQVRPDRGEPWARPRKPAEPGS